LEPAIASSVLVLGLLITFAVRLSVFNCVALVGLFAFFHGYAHGSELPETASPLLYAVGFLFATASLHGMGIGLGVSTRKMNLVTRISGSLIVLTGVFLLANV
jgi:urease accessory protein